MAIETARQELESSGTTSKATRRRFLQALAKLIQQALHAATPDPVFQAMLLQHQAAPVQEYVLLSAQAEHDQRTVRTIVNAMAHPAKQQRAASAPLADALRSLHEASSTASWSRLAAVAQRLLANKTAPRQHLVRLLEESALTRLRGLEALAPDKQVLQYQALRNQAGPRPGSLDATAQGAASKKRGAKTEALAAQALQVLADRLERESENKDIYRVVTSLRTPSILLGDSKRGKGEWDAVLLHQHQQQPQQQQQQQANAKDTQSSTARSHGAPQGNNNVWNIVLLIEAKASADAAAKDLPRLLRGLKLLAQAKPGASYEFTTRQGTANLSGQSLAALSTDPAKLWHTVLYCSDEPPENGARPLSPASRMQLLSAPASLAYATKLQRGQPSTPLDLDPVWRQLLESPLWRPVLHQHQAIRQARELMVHPNDLLSAIQAV